MAKKIPLTIRLSEEKHQEVAELAGEEGVSINVLLSSALELYVQYRDAEKAFRAEWLGNLLMAERSEKSESNFYGGKDE